jgi:trigger factor
MEAYLQSANTTQAKLEEDFRADAERSVKAGFILDTVASQEEIKVSPEDLSAYVTEQAYRMGVAPDQLAKQLTDNGQLPAVATDVLRGNALGWLAAHARVVDEAGRPVDLSADASAAADAGDENADGESVEDDAGSEDAG